MSKKTAPADGVAMPRLTATLIPFPRQAIDLVAAAIEAHKRAAAAERDAFDAVLLLIPETTDQGRGEIMNYVQTLDPAIFPRIYRRVIAAMAEYALVPRPNR